jgi:hypothetical protein
VRLEFHRLEAIQRGGNRELHPVAEFTIELSVQGFMQAFGVQENVHDRFAEQGLIAPAGAPLAAAPPPPQASEVAEFFLIGKALARV